MVDSVGPFPEMNISHNIILPHEIDPYSSFAIRIGAPDFDRVGSATSVMTPILASTRSTFFQQYEFDFDPCATLHTDFRRLAKLRKWKQRSNSKVLRMPSLSPVVIVPTRSLIMVVEPNAATDVCADMNSGQVTFLC